MLAGRGAAVTLAASAGGSEEGRLVNRGTRACRTVGRRCPWPWRNQPTTLYTTVPLSKTLQRRYSSPALLIDNTDRPSSTPLPLNLPRFIDLQIWYIGSPSGYNAFNSVFLTKTNDKNNLPRGDYSKKLTVFNQEFSENVNRINQITIRVFTF